MPGGRTEGFSRGKREGEGRRHTHLEHLDEADTEGQVGHVGRYKGSRKESANGENVPVPSLLCHFNVSKAV